MWARRPRWLACLNALEKVRYCMHTMHTRHGLCTESCLNSHGLSYLLTFWLINPTYITQVEKGLVLTNSLAWMCYWSVITCDQSWILHSMLVSLHCSHKISLNKHTNTHRLACPLQVLYCHSKDNVNDLPVTEFAPDCNTLWWFAVICVTIETRSTKAGVSPAAFECMLCHKHWGTGLS